MSKRAFLAMSHTPLLGLNPVAADIESLLTNAISQARTKVEAFAPELVILIAPDHYNGFFNELMPPFCIGTEAEGVGDYLSPAGRLNVDAGIALDLVNHLMDDNFDMAVSRRMRVDHGFTQPLQLMWGGLETPPVVPLFLNAAAMPTVPRLKRCHLLGSSINKFLNRIPKRTLLIGSGGLSHEPPVPTLEHPDPGIRERITVKSQLSAADLEAKTRRVMAAGKALAAGDNSMKPLNPWWDKQFMDGIEQGGPSLSKLCEMGEETIVREAGFSAHESKTWLIARAALGEQPTECGMRFYKDIPDYIAGFGMMWLTQH
ncbi:3-carboxyethylcatechol 2,3-dioxygenase [Polaromonas sp.]|uniref:3-carboxyethylcatechol 2,3-dioxygenase n=1 Tax=Polaromonas sp. TaxID=1869339 RepID=UPI003BA94BB3